MEIRKAMATDSSLLSSLCADVQRLHAEHHPDFFKMPQSDDFAVTYFDEILLDPAVRIFIAEEDERALGYIFCKLFERPESPLTYVNRFLQIEHIAVRPVARRQGVGAALVWRAEELARETGIKKIQLSSWDFNGEAHAFFERHGFVKFEHRFWKKI